MLELNFKPFPTLETERLILRRQTLKDSQDIFELRTNVDAMFYIGRPRPVALSEAEDLINRIEDGIETNTAVGWGLSFKDRPKLIGNIGFHRIEREHYRAEIGYMLLPEYWNQGLMSEAIWRVVEYGFNTLKFHTIYANIDPNNLRSSAVLKKCGFIKEGLFKESFFYNGKFLDSEIYSMLTNLDK